MNDISSIGGLIKTGTTYAKDLAERVFWAFIAGAVGTATAAGPLDLFSAPYWASLASGGFGAVIALLAGLGARARGDKNSASLSKDV